MLVAAAGTALTGGTAALAATPSHPAKKPAVTVSPAKGRPMTRYVVRFKAPMAAGDSGGLIRRYVVNASGPAVNGCASDVSAYVDTARRGEHERVALKAPKGSGGLCHGVFHGKVTLVQTPVCDPPPTAAPAIVCPMFVIVDKTVGTFKFRVK